MSGPSPLTIELSQKQQAMLQQILRRHISTQRLVRRVQIILKAHQAVIVSDREKNLSALYRQWVEAPDVSAAADL